MSRPQCKCKECGRYFHVWCASPNSQGMPRPERSSTIHHMDPNGLFCTLRCAARYGVVFANFHRSKA